MFAAVRELNRKQDGNIIVEDSEGNQLNSSEQKVEKITEYFENIFKQEVTEPYPEIEPQALRIPITEHEVKSATKKLKNNKSPGSDNVQAELIKYGPRLVHSHIADILNEAARTGIKPTELSLGKLIPLPKPGKPKGPVKNLRPIILLSVLRKILAIIVVQRTFQKIRNVIDISQAAYSPGRSTTELVFTFKILIEKAICAEDFKVHLLMLDMSRAFDTIDRGCLLQDLSKVLEPDELHLVSLLLRDVQLQVYHDGVTGKAFTPDIGSPQGDCASPIWFIFYLHKALEAAKPYFEKPRDVNIDTNHDHPYHKNVEKDRKKTPKGQDSFCIGQQYADDASWATTSLRVKDSIKSIAPAELKRRNLLANEEKTEEYTVTRNGSTEWKNCKLLGSLLGNKEDISRRKQLASAAFSQNKKAICSKGISIHIRLRVFAALISSIFLYNCELWTLKSTDIKEIDVFHRSLLRQIVRTRFISNHRLYELCDTEPWSITIQRRRLSWFGHLIRLPDNAPAKQALAEARKRYKKLRGGQPLTWLRTIVRDFKSVGKTLSETIQIAKNRDEYMELVHGVMSLVNSPSSPESYSEV